MTNQTELFELSKSIVPGGVHSPVRSFKGLHTTPRFFKSAEGAMITDVEDKNYIDFCMSFGPLILGHKHPKVHAALKDQLERGWSYGACEPYSVELAKLVTSKISFIDQIRFVNSGTEAVMTALRLARGVTGKNKIIKFNGCYHGHVDSMLIKAGSGLAGSATASSAGVPESVAQDTLIVELNDLTALEEALHDHKNEVAAVIIEPLPANNGLLVQTNEYLKGVRELCDKHQALLIFDEVISGFRVAFDGMAGVTGVTPDIVTYGKVIGGGLPVGALGARREIMEHLAPIGNVYQAGTLSANPLAMVGGLANMQELTADNYQKLERNTNRICALFERFLNEYEGGRFSGIQMVRSHSLFWFHPKSSDSVLRSIDKIPPTLGEGFFDFFKTLLEKGIYLAPNAWEVGFVSLAHDEEVARELEKRLFS